MLVTVTVIDQFEAVAIDDQDHQFAGGRTSGETRPQLLLEGRVVTELGQGILTGASFQLGHGPHDTDAGRGLRREDLQRWDAR